MNAQELEQFRRQAKALLTLAGPIGASPQVVQMRGLRVVLADSMNSPAQYSLREALVVRGNFSCGPGSRFHAPIFAAGACEVGKGSRLHAIAADSTLRLAPNAQIEHCAWAAKHMELRSGSWADSAASNTSIQIAASAGAQRLFAPLIASQDRLPDFDPPPPPTTHLELPPPHRCPRPQLHMLPGFRPEKLSALGEETWYYDGNLSFPYPLLLRANLVVKGLFRCPAASLLEQDVKSGGSLHVGEGSISRGQLTSLADMVLADGCLFSGNLHARASLRLCTGVRGFQQDAPVEVSTDGALHLEPNVVVRGRLTAAAGARGASPELAAAMRLLMAETG